MTDMIYTSISVPIVVRVIPTKTGVIFIILAAWDGLSHVVQVESEDYAQIASNRSSHQQPNWILL